MADLQQENKFEISLRILSNEIIAVSVGISNLTNKWILAAVLITAMSSLGFIYYGPNISSIYRSFVTTKH